MFTLLSSVRSYSIAAFLLSRIPQMFFGGVCVVI